MAISSFKTPKHIRNKVDVKKDNNDTQSLLKSIKLSKNLDNLNLPNSKYDAFNGSMTKSSTFQNVGKQMFLSPQPKDYSQDLKQYIDGKKSTKREKLQQEALEILKNKTQPDNSKSLTN